MVRVREVPFGEGHGQQLLLYEMCGVNEKERVKAPVHRVVQCLRFARGNCKELEGVEMSEADRDGWWLFGRMYLPKNEICPRGWASRLFLGYRGVSRLVGGGVVREKCGITSDRDEGMVSTIRSDDCAASNLAS